MKESNVVKERMNIKECLRENNISIFDKNGEFVGITNIIEQFKNKMKI